MPRLFDALVKHNPSNREDVWINCDAISDLAKNEPDPWKLPSLCSPFGRCFMDMRIGEKSQFRNHIAGLQYMGAFITTLGKTKEFPLPSHYGVSDESYAHIVWVEPYMQINNTLHKDVSSFWLVDSRGRAVLTDHNPIFAQNDLPPETLVISVWRIVPFLFAISMMNAKNVELIDNPPPKKANARHIQKYGVPMLSYKILKVSPATLKHYTQELEEQAKNSEKRELPLHLVRGHFKDYRDGKGLFGRVKDVIWFQEQWRGNAERGIALKDYELHPPKEQK